MTSIFLKTFGCAHNMADSELLAHYLQEAGFEVLGVAKEIHAHNKRHLEDEIIGIMAADLVIYNTCTVKDPSDDKFFSLLKKTNKPVIIAGCIPQSQADAPWLKEYSAIGVDQLDSIVEVVQATLKGEVLHRLSRTDMPPDREVLPVLRRNRFVAIIPLLQGCLGGCAYCKTKSARGNLKSYPLQSIIKQIRLAHTQGLKEVWLVSEDNGAYGLDNGHSLPELLEEIGKIGGDWRIRVGMINPHYAYKYRKDLAEIFNKYTCFYKFLHIPIQAGDQQVLKDMNRPYTLEQVKDVLDYLKENVDDITIATDIIAGYPTEKPRQFEKTLQLLEEGDFPILNISKFYPRPGTPAADLKLIPTREVKRRSKAITDWFAQTKFNKKYVGQTLSALFTEVGKEPNTYIGKTNNYRQVVVSSEENLLGQRRDVKIESFTRDDLRGVLV